MAVPPIPKRSRLYSLEPMNVGTAEVESLTGYVARLAEAHCVTVSDLVGGELSDFACPTPLFTRDPSSHRSNSFYPQSYSVNGIGDVPRKWVGVLETATQRRGLSDLTLLALADLFSESHLFRDVSAWCPSCFESRRRHDVQHESLLWTIGIVKVCPIHRELLEEICPHCRRRSRPLAAYARPSHCSRCGGWLGGGGATEKSMSESNLEREIWIAKSVGELLAAAPELKGFPLRERLSTNLSACIAAATSGNLLAFADLTRTPRGALRYWVSGAHRPQIGTLLRMCNQIGVPVTNLLGDPAAAGFDIAPIRNDRGIQLRRRGDEVRRALDCALTEEPPPSVFELARRLNFARPDRLYQIDRARSEMLAAGHREAIRALQTRPSRAPRKCERPQMKRILEASLAREYPVSITEIAVQNGYANAGCIRRGFRDVCRAIGQKIAQRRKAEMDGKGEILRAALEEDPPLTAAQMAGKLGFGCPGVLSRNFPALYQALLARRKAHEEAQKKQLHSDLISALAENPAPTVPAVCQRLGISTSWAYYLHGDLARAIAAKHLRYRAASTKRRRDLP